MVKFFVKLCTFLIIYFSAYLIVLNVSFRSISIFGPNSPMFENHVLASGKSLQPSWLLIYKIILQLLSSASAHLPLSSALSSGNYSAVSLLLLTCSFPLLDLVATILCCLSASVHLQLSSASSSGNYSAVLSAPDHQQLYSSSSKGNYSTLSAKPSLLRTSSFLMLDLVATTLLSLCFCSLAAFLCFIQWQLLCCLSTSAHLRLSSALSSGNYSAVLSASADQQLSSVSSSVDYSAVLSASAHYSGFPLLPLVSITLQSSLLLLTIAAFLCYLQWQLLCSPLLQFPD